MFITYCGKVYTRNQPRAHLMCPWSPSHCCVNTLYTVFCFFRRWAKNGYDKRYHLCPLLHGPSARVYGSCVQDKLASLHVYIPKFSSNENSSSYIGTEENLERSVPVFSQHGASSPPPSAPTNTSHFTPVQLPERRTAAVPESKWTE